MENRYPKFVLLSVIVIFLILLSLFITYKFKLFPVTKNLPVANNAESYVVAAPSIAPDFDKNLQNGPFYCPVIASFCETPGNFQDIALIGTVSKNTEVYAAFEGNVQMLIENYPPSTPSPIAIPETAILITLTNTNRGLRASYRFQGKVIPKTVVKEGEVLAITNGKTISSVNKNTFEFQILRFAQKNGGQYIKFTKEDFKQ